MLYTTCAFVTKSGNLNFLETSGPVQACIGTGLLLPLAYKLQRNFKFAERILSLSS